MVLNNDEDNEVELTVVMMMSECVGFNVPLDR